MRYLPKSQSDREVMLKDIGVNTVDDLFAAIPAVIGYNYLQGKIRRLIGEIDGFSFDFLNLVQKILNAQTQER